LLIENRDEAVFATEVIRRDYILRMIEAFSQALARIRSLKKDRQWDDAQHLLEGELKALMGLSASQLAGLSETELLALVCRNEPTQAVRTKMLMLTTLLNEAGDVAAIQRGAGDAREYYLKALDLLLGTLAREDVFDLPEFVPAIERIILNLEDAALPSGTLSLLMHHYERTGQFGKAEDALFALLGANPGNPAVIKFGIAFYQRLLTKSDEALSAGNLPRSEAQEALNELRRQCGPSSR
jgi:hypothetical protein